MSSSTGLGGAWSLCVEITFYALLPVLAAALGRLARGRGVDRAVRLQLLLIAVLALDSLAFRFSLDGSASYSVSTGHLVAATSLPGLLDWFCIGMVLAVLRSDWEQGGRALAPLASLSARPALCLLGAAACYWLVVSTGPGDPFLSLYALVDHVALGAGAGLLVLIAVHPGRPGRTARFLSSRAMVWLGSVSYGVYLWHLAVIRALTGPHGFGHPQGIATVAGVLIAVAAIAVALGAASLYLVEAPAQRLAARLATGPRPAAAGAEAGA